MEFRSTADIGGRFKDLDESKRHVLVEFPNRRIDTFGTDFDDGSFAESFRRSLPTMCWNHDLSEPIGKAVSAQALRHSHEIVGRFSDFNAVPRARQAFTQLRDGDLTDWSFGFTRDASVPHPEVRGATRITRATMGEFSPVSMGSIPGAKTLAIRSRGSLCDVDRVLAELEEWEELQRREVRALEILDRRSPALISGARARPPVRLSAIDEQRALQRLERRIG